MCEGCSALCSHKFNNVANAAELQACMYGIKSSEQFIPLIPNMF